MYYSNGNYEAFARPRKPKGVENKTACFVGSGLAALAGAAFLIRDGQMPGNRITIYRKQPDGRWLLARDAHTLAPVAS